VDFKRAVDESNSTVRITSHSTNTQIHIPPHLF
jgi:hypothetical protein